MTTSVDTPLWEFVDISKAYPGALANDKVCIRLMPGSIHGLLGENGCGKSTMIKTLSGVQQPDSGEVRHNGKPVVISDPHKARDFGIATVFQEFSIVPTLSVGENIFLGNERATGGNMLYLLQKFGYLQVQCWGVTLLSI